MYAKFLIYDEKDDYHQCIGVSPESRGISTKSGDKISIIPYVEDIIEGRRFVYRKIRIKDHSELEKIFDKIYHEYLNTVTNMPRPPIDDQDNESQEFEIIILKVYYGIDDLSENIRYFMAAANTTLFIMNNDGKTIDKISYRNQN